MSLLDSKNNNEATQDQEFSVSKRTSKINNRTKKVLHVLVFGIFPDTDKDIDSSDLLSKIKEKFKSPEEIWRKSIDVINSSVTVARDPNQSDVEHYAAVKEKRAEYIEDLRLAYNEINQLFHEERIAQEISSLSIAEQAQVGRQLPELKKLAKESVDQNQENVKEERYHPDQVTIQSMKDFIDFSKKYRDQIESRQALGESTASIIYDIFYSENLDSEVRHHEDDPEIEAINNKLKQEANRVDGRINAFINRLEENRNVLEIMQDVSMKNQNWLYYRSFAGHDRKLPTGRIYLNVDWSAAPEALRQILLSCWKDEIRMEIKTALSVDAVDINRNDRVIIYFNDKDTEKIIEKINELYKNRPEIFLDGAPRSTAPVVNREGEKMNGVLFAESPINHYLSYGEVRSAIFADLYEQSRRLNLEIDDQRFEPAKRFKAACLARGVDPEHIAFNANSHAFGVIKERAKLVKELS